MRTDLASIVSASAFGLGMHNKMSIDEVDDSRHFDWAAFL